MKTFREILIHLLPLSLGIGSIILKFNNITGWGWFLIISLLLYISETPSKKENDEK